jgi:ribosomal protein S18 acetylase RimI-like enzyme
MHSLNLSKSDPIAIRDMRDEDIPAVGELAARIWRRHYRAIISDAQIDYMLELMYAPDALRKQLASGQRFHLLFHDDTLAGFAGIENKNAEGWFLHKFYIDQDKARMGLGKTLMEHLLHIHAPKTLSLHVNRKNIDAINFYFRHGFSIDRLIVTDIGNGYIMDDFVMKRSL